MTMDQLKDRLKKQLENAMDLRPGNIRTSTTLEGSEQCLYDQRSRKQCLYTHKICYVEIFAYNPDNPFSFRIYPKTMETPGFVTFTSSDKHGGNFRYNILNTTHNRFYEFGDHKKGDELIVVACGKYSSWGRVESSDVLLPFVLDLFGVHCNNYVDIDSNDAQLLLISQHVAGQNDS